MAVKERWPLRQIWLYREICKKKKKTTNNNKTKKQNNKSVLEQGEQRTRWDCGKQRNETVKNMHHVFCFCLFILFFYLTHVVVFVWDNFSFCDIGCGSRRFFMLLWRWQFMLPWRYSVCYGWLFSEWDCSVLWTTERSKRKFVSSTDLQFLPLVPTHKLARWNCITTNWCKYVYITTLSLDVSITQIGCCSHFSNDK
jgi:hypothetical protein